jgi:hypothetical protein
MGNNTVEPGGDGKTKSPLYSSGTPEMDSSNAQGAVEGPKKCPQGPMEYATQLTVEK